ncbi:hypothetical protein AB0O07_17540 [Streptomyces sp. NPDC093085]|uniref:hypothetical protein n=1 Tax=Streptomyces sp. NPDC093085 TaxID=3155068 RepID=UPI00343E06FF
MRVKTLIRNANPVPPPKPGALSPRAAAELAALAGQAESPAGGRSGGQGDRGADRPRTTVVAGRPSLRGFLLTAAACGVAVVVGGAALLLAPGGPADFADTGGGPGQIVIDQPYYETTARLEGAARVIVRVELGPGRAENPDDPEGTGGLPMTVAAARVVATGKGTVPGRSIEVAYMTPGTGPETPGLTAGREYVLLLKEDDDGRYGLVNTTQGWYGIDATGRRAVPGKENGVALSPGVLKALRLTE